MKTLATLLLLAPSSNAFQMRLKDGCSMQLEYLETIIKEAAIADCNNNPDDCEMDTSMEALDDEFSVNCNYFTK